MNERPAIYVFQGEDSYWLAHVPVLRGCIASGTTRDQAIANARRAFRAYLELLDARAMDEAAAELVGEHDFAAFRGADAEPVHSTVRRVLESGAARRARAS